MDTVKTQTETLIIAMRKLAEEIEQLVFTTAVKCGARGAV